MADQERKRCHLKVYKVHKVYKVCKVEAPLKTNFNLTSKFVDRYSIIQKKTIPNTKYQLSIINYHTS